MLIKSSAIVQISKSCSQEILQCKRNDDSDILAADGVRQLFLRRVGMCTASIFSTENLKIANMQIFSCAQLQSITIQKAPCV